MAKGILLVVEGSMQLGRQLLLDFDLAQSGAVISLDEVTGAADAPNQAVSLVVWKGAASKLLRGVPRILL